MLQPKITVNTNKRNQDEYKITMNGHPLEEVTKFKYLGATITSDGTSTQEIKI